jgi:nicotinamidase-related amidase
MKAATELKVPVIASEQYPRGLGPTVPEIAGLLPADAAPIAKTAFGCLDEPAFTKRFAEVDRPQVVLTGVEAHVCVLQTALQCQALGRAVYVVADATASRLPASAERAYARLAAEGVRIVTTEMVVFEWLGRAGTPAFKALSGLVK